MRNIFKERTLAVISDLSNEERMYLFRKTKELKEALSAGDNQKIDQFRINDPDFGIYEVFLENSTRTRESFKNAAKFHRVKLLSLSTDSSSFNKGESYADTFNTLIGYDNKVFVIRSELEGVCRWLRESSAHYAKRNNLKITPSFINAGDGKHEHPTQELLDEFTFLEDNKWKDDFIHIALIGDLFHGRTVHSKAHGLTIFDNVKIDLIAPIDLAMPSSYMEIMKENGFELRSFESIEEYITQGDIADKWYFTRPQLERMGDRILQKQAELRASITFNESFMDKIPEETHFYHPLPRHRAQPVIPSFLDATALNGWERQSHNGMLVRIVLLGLFAGVIGDDYSPCDNFSEITEEKDFIERVKIEADRKVKCYSEGVHPIRDGIVIDHISKGGSSSEIRQHMGIITRILGLHGKGGEWVSTSNKDSQLFKGIIFRPDVKEFDRTSLKRLAALAPGSTLNIIVNGQVKEKYRLHLPPKIYNFNDLSCKNEACISNPEHKENAPACFLRTAGDEFICDYCGKHHTFKEIWN